MQVLAHTTLKKVLSVALHLLVWGALFALPLFFTAGDNTPRNYYGYYRTWLPLAFSAIVFYVNYWVLIDKFLFDRRILAFLLINLALFALGMVGIEWIKDLLPHGSRGMLPRRQISTFKALLWFRDGLTFLLTTGASVAIRVTDMWYRTENERRKAENERLRSEITHLKYQLQPHFFFNTLNTIYSLVESAPGKAQDAIHGLGKLMRYLLYETEGEKTNVAKEIQFLENYLRLMAMRMPVHVKVDYNFQQGGEEVIIAPLLFISLVENAFKHGVSATQPSFIAIKMNWDERQLFFQIENTHFPKAGEDQSGSGIGLDNLKKRLDLLYGNQYEFTQKLRDGVFYTQLTIER